MLQPDDSRSTEPVRRQSLMKKERGLPLPDPNDPSWRQWLTFLFGRPRPRDYDRSRAK